MAKIKVSLIEVNRLLREGIAAMLTNQGESEVVAKSEDGDSVRQLKNPGTPPPGRSPGSGPGKDKQLKADGAASKRKPDRNHVHNVLEKLSLGSRLQIAAFARKDDFC